MGSRKKWIAAHEAKEASKRRAEAALGGRYAPAATRPDKTFADKTAAKRGITGRPILMGC
jgi:hypothetical protein